jgi:hypothetical protein
MQQQQTQTTKSPSSLLTDHDRDGRQTVYAPVDLDRLLNEHRQRYGGTCDFPMPRDSQYKLTYAPTMWQFWSSDPLKKAFRRQPLVLHGSAPLELAMMDYEHRKEDAVRDVQPGHFNTTGFMGESGQVADALARAHRDYSLLNSRPKSGPVVITQYY